MQSALSCLANSLTKFNSNVVLQLVYYSDLSELGHVHYCMCRSIVRGRGYELLTPQWLQKAWHFHQVQIVYYFYFPEMRLDFFCPS